MGDSELRFRLRLATRTYERNVQTGQLGDGLWAVRRVAAMPPDRDLETDAIEERGSVLSFRGAGASQLPPLPDPSSCRKSAA